MIKDSGLKDQSFIRDKILIPNLNYKEKLTFFLKIISCKNKDFFDTKESEIETLLSYIPPFPLDISTCAYYIKTTNTSISQYIKFFKEGNKKFINRQENILKNQGLYKNSRNKIISLHVKSLLNEEEDFKDLLALTCLLNSQNIPKDLLTSFKDEITANNFIYHLKKNSLIITRLKESFISEFSLSFHRSIQEEILNILTKEYNILSDRYIINSIVQLLENYMLDAIKESSFSYLKEILPHIEAFLQHKNILTSEEEIRIKGPFGYIQLILDNRKEAGELLQRSLYIYKKNNIKNNYLLARLEFYLGNFKRSQRNYREALEYLEHSLILYEKYSPKDLEGINGNLISLGSIYRELGEFKKAESILKKSIEISKNIYGFNHEKVYWSCVNLGVMYGHFGYCNETLEILEHYETFYRRTLGQNHQKYGWILIRLGNTYRKLGMYEKAKEIMELGLENHKKNYSKKDLILAWAFILVGNLYREIGNYKEAEEFIKAGFHIYKNTYSSDHISLAWASLYLGKIFRDIGQYEKAETLLQRSLETHIMTYGQSHLNCAEVFNDLGELYLLQNQLIKAKTYLEKAYQIINIHKYPNSFSILENLGKLYSQLSNQENKVSKDKACLFKEHAKNYFLQALDIMKDQFANSLHTVRIKRKLEKL